MEREEEVDVTRYVALLQISALLQVFRRSWVFLEEEEEEEEEVFVPLLNARITSAEPLLHLYLIPLTGLKPPVLKREPRAILLGRIFIILFVRTPFLFDLIPSCNTLVPSGFQYALTLVLKRSVLGNQSS